MEKQLRLVLSLVLLYLFFGIFGGVSIKQMELLPQEELLLSQEQQQITEQGVLLLTRLELAERVEQTAA